MTHDAKIKGWHVFAGFSAAFSVIIGVNLVLAWAAVGTFPGLEVKNSYVASQSFDKRRSAQETLGWQVEARLVEGRLELAITDEYMKPVQAGKFDVVIGRPTHAEDDISPDFVFDGKVYAAPVSLRVGNWHVRIKAAALDGTKFQQRLSIYKAQP